MTGVGNGGSGGDGSERLDSWKTIAAYLGRDTGTVRRWERREGLPIHRLRHDAPTIENVARAELGLIRRGEVLVVLKTPETRE